MADDNTGFMNIAVWTRLGGRGALHRACAASHYLFPTATGKHLPPYRALCANGCRHGSHCPLYALSFKLTAVSLVACHSATAAARLTPHPVNL